MTNGPGPHEWRHGWIPLTPAAALMKAKGNRKLAARLRERHGIRGRDTRALVRGSRQSSLPDRPSSADRQRNQMADRVRQRAAERSASAELRALSDDALAARLASDADNDQAVERIVAELDRRDRAEAAARRRAAARQAAQQAKFRQQDAEYDRRLESGEDPIEAYAAAFGKDVERLRRQEAIASLRSAGYRGRGMEELTQDAFRDHARQAHLDAEAATNGFMVNRAGERAGVHSASLFVGPESRARKYASEELLRYWQDHGRLTVDDFRASILGGHMRSTSTGYFA